MRLVQAKNLMNAKQQLATVSKDLEFIKDSITTTEVRRVPGSALCSEGHVLQPALHCA